MWSIQYCSKPAGPRGATTAVGRPPPGIRLGTRTGANLAWLSESSRAGPGWQVRSPDAAGESLTSASRRGDLLAQVPWAVRDRMAGVTIRGRSDVGGLGVDGSSIVASGFGGDSLGCHVLGDASDLNVGGFESATAHRSGVAATRFPEAFETSSGQTVAGVAVFGVPAADTTVSSRPARCRGDWASFGLGPGGALVEWVVAGAGRVGTDLLSKPGGLDPDR